MHRHDCASFVTVRVTTLKGVGAGAYYVEQLPNYYLDTGEPRGRWLGQGAGLLSLAGDVDDEPFLALMSGLDPHRPDRHLGRRYNEDSARGFDVTASAPKSVSILFALGDDDMRRGVLDAHDAAVQAMAGWIERHAHTRYRIAGEVAVVDAEGIVGASFRQHTSRALDPQIHSHLVISNRVISPDGRWLALDARTIKRDQRTLSAIYHAGLRAELTRRLGVRWQQPVNGIAEIADISDSLVTEFSVRTGQVQRRIDEKLDRFMATMERQPTPRERWKLEREAAVDSRPTKPKGVDAAMLHQDWVEQVRALGLDPAAVVRDAVAKVPVSLRIDGSMNVPVMDWAMSELAEKQSTWRPAELVREIASLSPRDTADDADRVVGWAEGLASYLTASRCVDISKPVPPGALLRRDGRPVTEAATDRALTTRQILDQEHHIIEWADRRIDYEELGSHEVARRSCVALSEAQVDSAAAVAGRADLVLVVGPAGTGKTTALAAAVEQLLADGRTVCGVAPSATAAEVLSAETGAFTDTLDKLLIEHRLNRPPDHRYDLPAGTTVIVDEAGMVATAKLAELNQLADTRGWRIALVGDPRQFSSVGRGGMFGLLSDTFGAVELDRVHRFDNDWEREASLLLRRGDVEAAERYNEHGRLHGGTVQQMERASVEQWWSHRHASRPTLLMTPTNEVVERLNQRCQQLRKSVGEIDPNDRRVTAGSYRIFVGDEIATRQNDRHLVTDRGVTVKNRAVWIVDDVHADGSLTASGSQGTVRLPPSYVADHVDLAYATTGMGGQGRTVCGGILFIDKPTDVRHLYVPMTRGTAINEAFIATQGEQTALDVFTQCLTADWIDEPATSRQAELNAEKPHRPGAVDDDELVDLFQRRHLITLSIDDAKYCLKMLPSRLREADQRRRDVERATADQLALLREAREILERYDRPLNRRRRSAELALARRHVEVLPDAIRESRRCAIAATEAADVVRQSAASAQDLLQRRSELDDEVRAIEERLARDLSVRSRIARLERPASAIAVFGDRPAPGRTAHQWDRAAARLAQHQAAFGISHGLGRRPVPMEQSAYADSYRELSQLVADVARRDLAPEPPSRGLGLSL